MGVGIERYLCGNGSNMSGINAMELRSVSLIQLLGRNSQQSGVMEILTSAVLIVKTKRCSLLEVDPFRTLQMERHTEKVIQFRLEADVIRFTIKC